MFYYTYFHFPILIGLLPTLSILAYRNVRRILQRQTSHIQRRLDQQLTAMVLALSILLILVTPPFAIYRIYVLIIQVDRNNPPQKDIESITTLIFRYECILYILNG